MADETHMKVTPKSFTLKEIATGYYEDEATNAVVGMGGRLDIRPKYQRQFVYTKDKQDKLIQSILYDYPINVMYWVQIGVDASGNPRYEVLDGQQRLISICRFMTQGTAINFGNNVVSYGGSPEAVDNYNKLTVYVCEKGSLQSDDSFEKEKLAWFEIINIAGTTLTHQEILSALKYSDWCTSAKGYFVQKDSAGATAYSYGVQRKHHSNDYLSAKNIEKTDKDRENEKGNSDVYNRQEIFANVLKWKTGHGLKLGSDLDVETYMELHKDSKKYPDASELWEYFKNVMNWVWEVFEGTEDRYDSAMKNVEWGLLYNVYGSVKTISFDWVRKRIDELSCYEVDKSGKYYFVLDEAVNGFAKADQSVLHLRAFPPKIAENVYKKQHGICPGCGCHFQDQHDMQADHIKPWSKGGFTDEDNCQMLCADCNNKKSNDIHFGQMFSKDQVIAFTQQEIDARPEGVLNAKK